MKLDRDEKEREIERKDPATQLLEEKNLDEVLPHPSAFLNAKGQLWQNPVLNSDGTTVDKDEVSKKKKTTILKQPILDLNLKRAMQQYRRFRDELRSLQQTLLENNKIHDVLMTQLAGVETDFIYADNFQFLEHARDLTQITECCRWLPQSA